MNTKSVAVSISCLALVALQGCKHPLAIVGEGDIIELTGSGRGCSLEQFSAQDAACTENEVTGDYVVNYKAEPRPGWRFVKWQGPCAPDSDFGHCGQKIPAHVVAQWDESDESMGIPPSTAVFQPIDGETGYLLAGTAVAGVTYTTPTQQGVTGLDGSFQYAEGERVRFAIGATALGEVAGRLQVTPFDLAGSPVLKGIKIAWALRDEGVPLNVVLNLAVLLQSLDQDGTPGNGIVITRGVTDLLSNVKLGVRQRLDDFPGYVEPEGGDLQVAQDWAGFRDDPTLRHLLGRANREHRFSVPHGVARPEIAMARLYNALGIDPRIVGLAYLQTQNQDGQSWEQFAYDPGGNLVQHETSEFGGAMETWQYNIRGQVTLHEQHAEELDHYLMSTHSYDGRGNLIHAETQFSGNNAVWSGYSHTENNRYDKDSNPLKEESVRTSEEGTETDLSVYSYSYDNRGRLAQYIVEGEQHYSDGSLFQSVEYFDYLHDANGILRRYSQARDVGDIDGVPEQSWSWWFDPQSWVSRHESTFAFVPDQDDPAGLRWTWQYDVDGKVTRYGAFDDAWLFRYEYGPDGNTTRRERVNSASGTVEEVVTWSYDGVGRITGKEVLNTGDYPSTAGVDHSTESWQYHANGRVGLYTYEETFQGSDLGAPFERGENREYQYDAGGNLTRYTSRNQFDDWQEEQIYSWSYDTVGNLIREEVDSNGGERYVNTWAYDSSGNPMRYARDEDGNGSIEETWEYRYEVTGWGFLFARIAPFGSNYPLPRKPGESFEYIPLPSPPM